MADPIGKLPGGATAGPARLTRIEGVSKREYHENPALPVEISWVFAICGGIGPFHSGGRVHSGAVNHCGVSSQPDREPCVSSTQHQRKRPIQVNEVDTVPL